MTTTTTLTSLTDLTAAIRGLRPDALALDVAITPDWVREQMHAAGVTRYEDVDAMLISQIADAVDAL